MIALNLTNWEPSTENAVKFETQPDGDVGILQGPQMLGQYVTETIKHVTPRECIVLMDGKILPLFPLLLLTCGTLVFEQVQSEFNKSIQGLAFPEELTIRYNAWTRVLVVQGPKFGVVQAQAKFISQIELLHKSITQSHDELFQIYEGKVFGRLRPKPLKETGDTASSCRSFPLHVIRDRDLVDAWNQFVMPELPSILQPFIGENYSASLVRVGPSEHESRLCIQIECPDQTSSTVRKNIRKAIKDKLAQALEKPLMQPIQIEFLEGEPWQLGKENETDDLPEVVVEGSDLDNDQGRGDEECLDFPILKRWSKKPGMSASIGVLGDYRISASLGGYILVDNKPYILLPDHVVEKSVDQGRPPLSKNGHPYLTSPSLGDVREVKRCIEQIIRNTDADCVELLGLGQDMTMRKLMENTEFKEKVKMLKPQIQASILLLAEVQEPDDHYIIGEIEQRCRQRQRPFTGSAHIAATPASSNNLILMDWALCKLSDFSRRGENRYPFPPMHDFTTLDYAVHTSNGSDVPCSETCDLDPNVDVYYVGRRSGLRVGRISPTRLLVSRRGEQTSEFCMMIPSSARLGPKNFLGDSGAWVLTKHGNKVMAQVNGFANNQLIVSPIKDIFRDIIDTTGAKEVTLPKHGGPSELIEICEVAPLVSKPRKYKASSIPFPEISLPEAIDMMFKDADEALPIPTSCTESSPPSLSSGQSSEGLGENDLGPLQDISTSPATPPAVAEANPEIVDPDHSHRFEAIVEPLLINSNQAATSTHKLKLNYNLDDIPPLTTKTYTYHQPAIRKTAFTATRTDSFDKTETGITSAFSSIIFEFSNS